MQPDKLRSPEGGRRLRGEIRAEPPLVSIVTVLFEAKEELLSLLNNVPSFRCDDVEWIVIDGGSEDGTVDILRERDDKIDYWLSERDSGIYDAMNKGIAAARGEYVLHLNAGDRLKSIPHKTLSICLAEGLEIACFAVTMDQGETFQPATGPMLRIVNTWHHQGTFYRRTPDLVYDTRYRVYGDFHLNQRLLKSGKKVALFKEVVSHHRKDGLSQSGRYQDEVYRSVRENFGRPYLPPAYLWSGYQALRRAAKRMIGFRQP